MSQQHRMSPTLKPAPGSLGNLMPGYRDKASDQLAELGIEIDEASLHVRRSFEAAIIAKYRSTLEHELPDRVDLALKLQKDKGTRSRWERGERDPDWDSLFLSLAAFDVDVGPTIPRGREVVIHAICRTVPMLRTKYLNGEDEKLSKDQLVCLHYVMQSKMWSLASETQKQKHWKNAFIDLRPLIAHCSPRLEITDCSDIASHIQGWTLPFWVFQYLVPHDWQYHEIEKDDGDAN